MQIEKNSQLRLLYSLVGLVLLILCLIAQFSSLLTPLINRSEFAILFLGSGGRTLLALFAGLTLIVGFKRRSKDYYTAAIISLIVLGMTYLNLWAEVFQYTLAGLTVGGGLIILGSRDFIHKYKR